MSFHYYSLSSFQMAHRKPIWDSLAARKPCGRTAVCGCPKPDEAEVMRILPPEDQIPLMGRPEKIRNGIKSCVGRSLRSMQQR